DLSARATIAHRILLQSFRSILSRDLVLWDCAGDSPRGAPPQRRTEIAEYRRGDCPRWSRVSGSWNCDALCDCRPPAGNEHVRVDHLCSVRGLIFRDDLLHALSDTGIFARSIASDAHRAPARTSNADRDAIEHRSTRAGVTRYFLAHGSYAHDHVELCGFRAGNGLRSHSTPAVRAQPGGGVSRRTNAFLALPRAA